MTESDDLLELGGRERDAKKPKHDDFRVSKDDEKVRDSSDYSGLTCCGKMRFFVKQSFKDVKRHKCQFCLSFCSVFVVVLSILCVVTITELGPIIFLRLSEKAYGEYDGMFTSRGNPDLSLSDVDNIGYFLSYQVLQD